MRVLLLWLAFNHFCIAYSIFLYAPNVFVVYPLSFPSLFSPNLGMTLILYIIRSIDYPTFFPCSLHLSLGKIWQTKIFLQVFFRGMYKSLTIPKLRNQSKMSFYFHSFGKFLKKKDVELSQVILMYCSIFTLYLLPSSLLCRVVVLRLPLLSLYRLDFVWWGSWMQLE